MIPNGDCGDIRQHATFNVLSSQHNHTNVNGARKSSPLQWITAGEDGILVAYTLDKATQAKLESRLFMPIAKHCFKTLALARRA